MEEFYCIAILIMFTLLPKNHSETVAHYEINGDAVVYGRKRVFTFIWIV
jgi:hypothetical protein